MPRASRSTAARSARPRRSTSASPTSSPTAGGCCSPRRSSPSTRSSYNQLAIIFPFIVTAPGFFAGTITLGAMMQTASAFGQVQKALSFFIENYTYLAELRAVMDRLKGLQAGVRRQARHRHRGGAGSRPRRSRRGGPDAWPAQRPGAAVGRDLHPAARPLDPDHGRQRLGQEHAVPRAGRHLAVRPGPGARAGRRARAVPAAEALHPDRHPARRGEVSRRGLEGDGCRDRGGAGGGEARPSRRPPRRGRALDQHPVGRRAAARWPRRVRWCSSPTGCSSTRPRPRSTRRWKPRSTRP